MTFLLFLAAYFIVGFFVSKYFLLEHGDTRNGSGSDSDLGLGCAIFTMSFVWLPLLLLYAFAFLFVTFLEFLGSAGKKK